MNTPLPWKVVLVLSLLVLSEVSLAAVKEIRLPTAEDGEVTYQFDTETKKPLSAKDDRSEVMTLALTFLPKKPGDPLRWALLYEVRFETGTTPKSIDVFNENDKRLSIEAHDVEPTLTNNLWSATSKPNAMDVRAWKAMTGPDPWFLQRKIVVRYGDGVERTLHQLAVITNPMRIGLLEQIAGKSISTTTAALVFDSRSWKIGFEAQDKARHITEFVLPGQTVNSWEELFTRQLFFDVDHQIQLDEVTTRVRQGFGSDCKSIRWDVVKQGEMETIYQWTHEGCGANPPQFEVSRLVRTARGICRWAYTSKLTPVAEATQKHFRSVIEGLKCE